MGRLNLFILAVFIMSSVWREGCAAELQTHLKPILDKTMYNPIPNIDFIYLINLDQRPEKLYDSLRQLSPFNIVPCRFPAIYGWSLSAETLNDVGMKFLPGMHADQWVIQFKGAGNYEYDFPSDASIGKTYFSTCTSLGAIGCTLSHLSILQDAYNAGYKIIWIMEDDISVSGNPLILSDLIDKLDSVVGREGWDILYTDNDSANAYLYNAPNTFETDLRGRFFCMWRPDISSDDQTPYRKRSVISPDFVKIGSRMRTHSMIITRTGIEKILNYEKSHGMFTPYDHELALIPGIQMFNLRYPLVTFSETSSDTHNQHF